MFGKTVERIGRWPKKALILLIRGYRYVISPWLGSACRFYPSCSEYAEHCFEKFGLLTALRLTLLRLSKCHPWHVGGEDPVPSTHPTCLSILSTSVATED